MKKKAYKSTSTTVLIFFLVVQVQVEPSEISPPKGKGKIVTFGNLTEVRSGVIVKSIAGPDNGCSCAKKMCSCCVDLFIPFVLNTEVCISVSYRPAALGVATVVAVDGNDVFEAEISVRNLPPFCFWIPFLKKLGKVCLTLHNISWRQNIGACFKIGIRVLWVVHKDLHLGCFHFNDLETDAKAAVSKILFELHELRGLGNAGISNFERDRAIMFYGIFLSAFLLR